MKKRKLIYCNPVNFFDTDATVIHHLKNEYEIVWYPIIQSNQTSEKYTIGELREYALKYNIDFRPYFINCRFRSLKNIKYYYKLMSDIFADDPDVVFTCTNIIYWHIILLLLFYRERRKVVKGFHDVEIHSNTKFHVFYKIMNWLCAKFYNKCVTYSVSQNNIFKNKYHKSAYCVGMSVKDFGDSEESSISIMNEIKILFFGGISKYKGIDILINTLEELSKENIFRFKLSIYGKGDFWNECESLIKTKSLYNINIRFIRNDEIPQLMSTHHFLILPYRDVTNSGPMMIALNYKLPIIAPRIGCFMDIYDDETAVLYEPGNIYNTLKKLSHITDEEYNNMKIACEHLYLNYTQEAISKRYIDIFNSVK